MVAMQGDKQESARALGISLKTLYARLNVYAASKTPCDSPRMGD
jgi:DNA-binding NtrC family response regulator